MKRTLLKLKDELLVVASLVYAGVMQVVDGGGTLNWRTLTPVVVAVVVRRYTWADSAFKELERELLATQEQLASQKAREALQAAQAPTPTQTVSEAHSGAPVSSPGFLGEASLLYEFGDPGTR